MASADDDDGDDGGDDDGEGATGNEVDDDGDGVTGDDVDKDVNGAGRRRRYGATGCNDEDDVRQRATDSMMIATARRTTTSTTMMTARRATTSTMMATARQATTMMANVQRRHISLCHNATLPLFTLFNPLLGKMDYPKVLHSTRHLNSDPTSWRKPCKKKRKYLKNAESQSGSA